jgi:hypothetical protein
MRLPQSGPGTGQMHEGIRPLIEHSSRQPAAGTRHARIARKHTDQKTCTTPRQGAASQ